MITDLIEKFKTKINKGPVFGLFSKATDPAFIEATGYSGFDFIIIDLEHGPNTIENAQNLVRAAQISNMLPIIRVKEDAPFIIKEALDIGAGGIQVPQITCPEDIEEVIRLARFAPEGMRGICPFVRAADYSSVKKDIYFKKANDAVLIIQLEGKESLDNLDNILDMEGYDILFIGPYDLSQSLGIQGQIEHPLLEEKISSIVDKCSSKGIIVGIFAETIKMAKKWAGLGVKYISYSADIKIYFSVCKEILNNLK